MRPGTVLGALLVFAGVVALSIGGVHLAQRPVPTLLGGLAIAAGIFLIVASTRKAH